MSTLKSLAIVGAVFVVVVAVAAALSLFYRGSPDDPDSQTASAATESPPATEVSPAAAVESVPDAPAPVEEAVGAIAPGADHSRPDRDYTIVEILPKNFIPAIKYPYFYDVEDAVGFYSDEELVIGLSIGGEHRAYSVPYLSSREIVNDTVGGVKVAVTW